MKIPESLLPLLDQGIIDSVVRPLMSGKEAQVFLVMSEGEQRVAKVYKDAQHRSFKHRADYTEGRRGRSSRDQRAIAKGSKHGKEQEELAWRSAEVDMIYRLRAAGLRVPEPYHFVDGVLVMELVQDLDGNPAPRLGDVEMEPDEALSVFHTLLGEVIKMLCSGVIHGDFSDFNVLLGADGPVVIDFPQSFDAAQNQNAKEILVRDVANLQRFAVERGITDLPQRYAQEMWELYARGDLKPDSALTGHHRASERQADLRGLLQELADDERDEMRRRGVPA